MDREVLAMGTRLGLHLEGADRDLLQRESERMVADVERIEAACSTRRPESQWSRLNAAGGEAVPLDPEWLDLLETAQAWSRRAHGAFEPVILALLRAWGDGAPTEERRTEALWATGSDLLTLDREAGTARLGHPRAGLEGGAFLKGYALDAARRHASGPGWLDFGGQILSWGGPREAAVAGPGDRLAPVLALRLPDGASLSSSGCSERGRHLMDPRTGLPCPDWGAVAAVAPSGLEAEVLSTALYVMGPGEGREWARSQGAAAVFLPHGGGLVWTPAFEKLQPALVNNSR